MTRDDAPIDGLLIDLAGVLYAGDQAIPGSVRAVQRLNEAGVPIRFLTNTTRKTPAALLERLTGLGFAVTAAQIFSAPAAALHYLEAHRRRAHLLIHPDLRPAFDGVDTHQPDTVVVGDAGAAFDYAAMNRALNVLLAAGDAALILAMGQSRYFRDGDQMALDMGPYVQALAFATEAETVVVGKPAAAFFQQALDDLGLPAGRVAMIGDDLVSDVGGAQEAGLRAALVRTGKYQPSDEAHPSITPDFVGDDLAAVVDWVL